MKTFEYTITDPVGIHARPAGLLVKAVKVLDSVVIIENESGKSAVATQLMDVISLGVQQGDVIFITVEGGDEEANAAAIEQFLKDNL